MNNNHPRTITLINRKTQKRRIIHLITLTKEKSFKFASANCKQWVLKSGYPIVFRVSYGIHETVNEKKKEFTNEMECNNIEELQYGLQAFVKEYLEEVKRGI